MDTETKPPLDKRCRDVHPERITVGDKVLERNDITAKKFALTERSMNGHDKKGAPFVYVGNIKYRPQPDFDDYILTGIRSQRPSERQRPSAQRAAEKGVVARAEAARRRF